MTTLDILQVRKNDEIVKIATVDVDDKASIENLLEDIWHGCNVSCWDSGNVWKKTKKVELNEIVLNVTDEFNGVVNSDIIVTDNSLVNFAANSFGWSSFLSLGQAINYNKSKLI